MRYIALKCGGLGDEFWELEILKCVFLTGSTLLSEFWWYSVWKLITAFMELLLHTRTVDQVIRFLCLCLETAVITPHQDGKWSLAARTRYWIYIAQWILKVFGLKTYPNVYGVAIIKELLLYTRTVDQVIRFLCLCLETAVITSHQDGKWSLAAWARCTWPHLCDSERFHLLADLNPRQLRKARRWTLPSPLPVTGIWFLQLPRPRLSLGASVTLRRRKSVSRSREALRDNRLDSDANFSRHGAQSSFTSVNRSVSNYSTALPTTRPYTATECTIRNYRRVIIMSSWWLFILIFIAFVTVKQIPVVVSSCF